MDGLFIKGIDIRWDEAEEDLGYVAGIRPLRNTDHLELKKNITFFAGENGSGKSTLLEAIAIAAGLNAEGGTNNFRFSTYEDYSGLNRIVHLIRRGARPHSYFLRAESFYNVASAAMNQYNDDGRMTDLHARSHGESFFDFIMENDSVGLYLMDEPEAALSPQRQLSLLLLLHRMAEEGSQFIIATHSPILLAEPEAEILSFDGGQIRPIRYEETESYRITRMFMQDRQRMLKLLFEKDE